MLSVPAVPSPPGEIMPLAPFIMPFATLPRTVPEPASVCAVLPDPTVKAAERPETSKKAPLLTLMAGLLLEIEPEVPSDNVPPLIVIEPVWVLAPERVQVPPPLLVTFKAPGAGAAADRAGYFSIASALQGINSEAL